MRYCRKGKANNVQNRNNVQMLQIIILIILVNNKLFISKIDVF